VSQAVIGNLRVNLGIDTAQFSAGAREAQTTLAGLQNSLRGFGATAVGALSLSAIGGAVDQAIRKVAEIGDLAETIGITAEQVQVFNRMALASGASTEVMARGLQEIAEQSTDANSKLAKLFAANGLAVQGREVNDVIRDFMELLHNARTPAEQLAIITEVLGTKAGRELAEAFRIGADGYDKSLRRMIESGEYHSNAEVKRLQEIETKYNETIARIQTAWQKMVVHLATNLPRFDVGSGAITPDLKAQFQKFQDTRDGVVTAPGKSDRVTTVTALGKTGLLRTNGKNTVRPTEGAGGTAGGAGRPGKPTRPDAAPSWAKVETVTGEDLRGTGLELRNLADDLAEADSYAARLGTTLADDLSYSLSSIAMNARSAGDAFDMLKETALDVLGSIGQQLLRSGLANLLGGAGTRFGGAQGLFGFGGFYADGGTLGAGQWGIAGEAGPEIIHGPARITPMEKARGGTAVTQTFNIDARGAQAGVGEEIKRALAGYDAALPARIANARRRGQI
jgi:hypothetical protein